MMRKLYTIDYKKRELGVSQKCHFKLSESHFLEHSK